MPPTNGGPLQQGRTIIVTSDGHVLDRHLVYIEDFAPGNLKDAMSAMPALGTADPEQLGAPLYSQQIVGVMDGKKAYGQLTYDNRGGGGYFIGKLARGSRTNKALVAKFMLPQIQTFTPPGGSRISVRHDPIETYRAHRYRVETRTIRTGDLDSLIEEVDSQIGKTWFRSGIHYIFSDWAYATSDYNTYRIEYEFYAAGRVAGRPAEGGILAVPDLGVNQEFKFVYSPGTATIDRIDAVSQYSTEPGDQVVLQQL